MRPDPSEEEKDQSLAAYTDSLLAGGEWEGDERPPLADVVQILARTINHEPPPISLRNKIKRRIRAEWPQPHPSIRQRLNALMRPATRRWVLGAAAGLALLLVTALAFSGQTEGESVAGTAIGDVGTLLLIVVLVLAGIVGLAWWVDRKKKK